MSIQTILDTQRHRALRFAAAALTAGALVATMSACGEDPFIPNAECSNGAERVLPCGVLQLGEQTQRCVQFLWEDVGTCSENLVCQPADTRVASCGLNDRGVETQLCGSNAWKPIDECTDRDVCVDGDVFSEACGLNARGSQDVLCDTGQWALQDCVDSDVCVDGTLEFEDCDELGNTIRERSCIEGQWGDWATECTPNTCQEGEVDLDDCGFEDRGVLRTSCSGGQLRTTGECEMRGEYVYLQDTHLFLVAEDGVLFVSGGTGGALDGRVTEGEARATLREPFEQRVLIEAKDHIAVSDRHACMVQEGEVYCWGDNSQGQLGVDTAQASSRVPVLVANVGSGANPAVQVVVTPKVSCARLRNGDARCWGWNGSEGGVGVGTDSSVKLPVQPIGFLDPIPPAQRLFAQEQMVCARVLGGAVYCWGDNLHSVRFSYVYYVLPGQRRQLFGRRGVIEPTKVQPLNREGHQVESIQLSRENGCARYSDGAVYCWGDNKNGEIGDGGTRSNIDPQLAVAPGSVTSQSLHAEAYRRCVRMSDQSVRCWGRQPMGDANGRLLPNIAESVTSPSVTLRFLGADAPVEALSIAYTAACAVQEDGVLRCTGVSNTGSFGRGELQSSQGDAQPVLCPPALLD